MAGLTELQGEILRRFFARRDEFFLTGGAALVGFHLGHRETHDLDLFTTNGVATKSNVKLRTVTQGPQRTIIVASFTAVGSGGVSYTSATAYQGLVSAARLAERIGDASAARRYAHRASQLKAAFNREFVGEGGFIRGLQEETAITKCLDAGAVEGINFGVVSDTVARRTLQVFDRYLKKEHTVGYMRNDDGGDYDRHEWVVIDLRIATAFARLGETARYDALVNWVTAQSALNFNLIAELYSHDEADYTGAVPMCGFGPGAYIAALFARGH